MICENCGKEHNGSYGSGRFCSKECARSFSTKKSHNQFKEVKCIKCGKNILVGKRASAEVCICEDCKTLYEKYNHTCIICGKEFNGRHRKTCSDKCHNEYLKNRKLYLSNESIKKLSETARKNIYKQNNLRRSKNEIEFCKLCENYFNNVEHNKPIFNGWDADIIINDIKYAILWNDKWHYEQISKKQSLLQIQNRDKIKIEEIKKCNYIPYIIKDMGSYNLEFVKEKFNEFINYLKENNNY